MEEGCSHPLGYQIKKYYGRFICFLFFLGKGHKEKGTKFIDQLKENGGTNLNKI